MAAALCLRTGTSNSTGGTMRALNYPLDINPKFVSTVDLLSLHIKPLTRILAGYNHTPQPESKRNGAHISTMHVIDNKCTPQTIDRACNTPDYGKNDTDPAG